MSIVIIEFKKLAKNDFVQFSKKLFLFDFK